MWLQRCRDVSAQVVPWCNLYLKSSKVLFGRLSLPGGHHPRDKHLLLQWQVMSRTQESASHAMRTIRLSQRLAESHKLCANLLAIALFNTGRTSGGVALPGSATTVHPSANSHRLGPQGRNHIQSSSSKAGPNIAFKGERFYHASIKAFSGMISWREERLTKAGSRTS